MFDKTKLAALRAKYEDTKETEVAPERFRAPLADIFGSAYRRPMPYAGIPTLLDAPYRPDAAGLPDFGGLDVALIGVPMDLGVTNRPGARFGPRAVRDIERIGPYNHALEIVPRMLMQCRRHRRCADALALSASTNRIEDIDGVLSTASARPASCRCRSAAIIRSPIRS